MCINIHKYNMCNIAPPTSGLKYFFIVVHCWDYRKFIVQKAGISNEEEFEFSTTKILNNFSNYSSWHYRSRILYKMFGTTLEEIPIIDKKYKEGNNLYIIFFVF